MDAKVTDFLFNRYITVPNDWLRECIQFVVEDAGQQAKLPNWANANVPKLVYEQWLVANLCELKSSCLPPNLAEFKSIVINGYFALQVNTLQDISQPAYQQLIKIAGVDRSNAEVTAEPYTQKKEKSNRMLKLEMTDGMQTIHGMEYEEIPFLNVNTPPGVKVLVFGAIECRRGMLFLTKGNVKVLGGHLEEFGTENCQLHLLRRILNTTDYSDLAAESRLDTNGTVGITSTMPATSGTSAGQWHAPQIHPTWDDDEYDSIFLEDVENYDLNDTESQNAVASTRNNIPRLPLVTKNSNIIDFYGFDDDDDDAFQ